MSTEHPKRLLTSFETDRTHALTNICCYRCTIPVRPDNRCADTHAHIPCRNRVARSVVLITPSDRGYCAGAAAAALGAGAQKLITQNKNPFGMQRRCLASRQSFCALGAVRLNLNFCASVRSVATMCACSAAEQQRYSIWAHKSVCVPFLLARARTNFTFRANTREQSSI